MEPDFSGYATKADVTCKDGRIIRPDAFKDMDGKTVPLVWQHGHESPDNVLGHAVLEAVSDGVRAHAFFNDTSAGQTAKALVIHEDVRSLSIWANNLVERGKQVLHGVIREVSLVLGGANPGALIDYVRVVHGIDDVEVLSEEAIIYTGLDLEFKHVDTSNSGTSSGSSSDTTTIQDVYDSLDEMQKQVVNYLVGAAIEEATSAAHSDVDGSSSSAVDKKTTDNDDKVLSTDATNDGGPQVKHNVFDKTDDEGKGKGSSSVLSHADIKGIFADAMRGGSLKEAVEGYVIKHGIDDVSTLFPDAKLLTNTPDFDKRRTEWVAGVLNGTRHSPFSRIKTITADITLEEARAKGYVTGAMKKEQWFGVSKRTTTPTTVYKKQSLDRDDVLDITDFDVVAWIKGEMRLMLEEELARAILIGDGRDVSDADKVKDPIGAADGSGIRSILNDHDLFRSVISVNVDDADSNYDEVVDAVLDGMEYYKGTGTPDFYTTIRTLNKFLKLKDTLGRRIYQTKADVAAALGVANIITVEPMNDETDLIGIIVNLQDYNIGADRGGEVNLFDDFDIDYNKQKFLTETRVSGALTKFKSALVIKKVAAAAVLLDAPTKPTFVSTTGVVTIPTVTHVKYYDTTDLDNALSAGAQTALGVGGSISIVAVADTGYYFAQGAEAGPWTYYSRQTA